MLRARHINIARLLEQIMTTDPRIALLVLAHVLTAGVIANKYICPG